MIRVVLVDEGYRSIGEAQHRFIESADGRFLMNLCISIVLWCLSFVNIYLSLFKGARCSSKQGGGYAGGVECRTKKIRSSSSSHIIPAGFPHWMHFQPLSPMKTKTRLLKP